jgi:hypothetical protein
MPTVKKCARREPRSFALQAFKVSFGLLYSGEVCLYRVEEIYDLTGPPFQQLNPESRADTTAAQKRIRTAVKSSPFVSASCYGTGVIPVNGDPLDLFHSQVSECRCKAPSTQAGSTGNW